MAGGPLVTLGNMLGGDIIKDVGDIAARYIPGAADREAFQLELNKAADARAAEADNLIKSHDAAVVAVIQSDNATGDKYTSRARPTIIYGGLIIMAWNYCLIPLIAHLGGGAQLAPVDLPGGFWDVWGGVCGLYTIARTIDKAGGPAAAYAAVTGKGK